MRKMALGEVKEVDLICLGTTMKRTPQEKGNTSRWPALTEQMQSKGPQGQSYSTQREACKHGRSCREALAKRSCTSWHPKEEFKFLLDKFKAKTLAKKGAEKGRAKGGGKRTDAQGRGKGKGAGAVACYNCGGPHYKKDCPKADQTGAKKTEIVARIQDGQQKRARSRQLSLIHI